MDIWFIDEVVVAVLVSRLFVSIASKAEILTNITANIIIKEIQRKKATAAIIGSIMIFTENLLVLFAPWLG